MEYLVLADAVLFALGNRPEAPPDSLGRTDEWAHSDRSRATSIGLQRAKPSSRIGGDDNLAG
jgi:hypothetical protein